MAEIISGEVVVSSGTTKTGLYVVQGGILKILDEGFAKDVGLTDGGKVEVYEEGIFASYPVGWTDFLI